MLRVFPGVELVLARFLRFQQLVDQRRFAHVGTAEEEDFGPVVVGQQAASKKVPASSDFFVFIARLSAKGAYCNFASCNGPDDLALDVFDFDGIFQDDVQQLVHGVDGGDADVAA